MKSPGDPPRVLSFTEHWSIRAMEQWDNAVEAASPGGTACGGTVTYGWSHNNKLVRVQWER